MSGEKVLRQAVEDHRRELSAFQMRYGQLSAEYANAKSRWEALRKALDRWAQARWISAGYDERDAITALRVALAALEEPAPADTGYLGDGGPVGRCAKTGGTGDDCAACCNIGTDHSGPPKELLKPHTCDPEGPRDLTCPGCSQDYWGAPNPIQRNSTSVPAPSSAPDREALVNEYGAACASAYGHAYHPLVRARRAALLAAWEAEVAALRAEVDMATTTRIAAERRALAAEAALATERARALEEAAHGTTPWTGRLEGLCREMVQSFDAEGWEWLPAMVGTIDRHLRAKGSKVCPKHGARDTGAGRFYECGCHESPPPAPAPQGEEDGFEGHPPGVCLEHDRFRLEGAGLIDTEGHFDRCTGCGQLPPHAGCKAICAACAPPTGACYCAGCQVAGKASPPPAPAPQGEERTRWTCACGYMNNTVICTKCGAPRAEEVDK